MTFQVEVRIPDDQRQTWTIAASEEEPWEAILQATDGREWRARARDLFEAVQQVRRQTDPLGIRLCINAARVDAYPSGTSRDMGGGQMLYIFRRGNWISRLWHRPRLSNLVFLFDPAPCEFIATVEEQERNFADWVGQDT